MCVIGCQSLRRRRKGLTLTFVQRIRMELLEVILARSEHLDGVWTLLGQEERTTCQHRLPTVDIQSLWHQDSDPEDYVFCC